MSNIIYNNIHTKSWFYESRCMFICNDLLQYINKTELPSHLSHEIIFHQLVSLIIKLVHYNTPLCAIIKIKNMNINDYITLFISHAGVPINLMSTDKTRDDLIASINKIPMINSIMNTTSFNKTTEYYLLISRYYSDYMNITFSDFCNKYKFDLSIHGHEQLYAGYIKESNMIKIHRSYSSLSINNANMVLDTYNGCSILMNKDVLLYLTRKHTN